MLVGCGGGAAAPGPVLLRGAPSSYVIALDGLPAAGFVAAEPPHPVDASALSGQAAVQSALRAAGLSGVASAHYVRQVPVLATANGPLDVVPTVAAFAAAAGAHDAMRRVVAELDARPGAGAVSAGDVGEESHAVTETALAGDGTRVEQVTVVWRVANLLNEMAVRGRLGGTGLGDAIAIARRQSAAEG
ncbi:MAG TPA: hypothetical protein VGE42_13090 [Candidatus Dormibacteraeota bacterium]